MPLISVIIPTFNDWERLWLCVNAILKNEFNRCSVEIIIINNGPPVPSTNITIDERVKLIECKKKGSYSARNLGIINSRGDYLLFTDADCIPSKKWISALYESLEDKKFEIVSGPIKLFSKNKIANVFELYELAFAFDQEFNKKTGLFPTANLGVKREIFYLLGLFDDSQMTGSDFEFCSRYLSIKDKVDFNADAIVYHPARYSLKALLKKRVRTSLKRKSNFKKIYPIHNASQLNHYIKRIKYLYKLTNKNPLKVVMVLMVAILLKLVSKFCNLYGKYLTSK